MTEKGKAPQLAVLQLAHGNGVLVVQLNAVPGAQRLRQRALTSPS